VYSKDKPYVLFVAEIIYLKIFEIKNNNPELSNINAIEIFIGTKVYKRISSGKFHDDWFKELEKNKFIDKETKNKVPDETLKLLRVQKDMVIKQLIHFPDLYYAKNHYPLEISQRAFDHLWRMCESYELWCKESQQKELIVLGILD